MGHNFSLVTYLQNHVFASISRFITMCIGDFLSKGHRQVVYAMDPRPPFSERVLLKVKTTTDGRSVDVISGNFS